jgi:hypothetical protein
MEIFNYGCLVTAAFGQTRHNMLDFRPTWIPKEKIQSAVGQGAESIQPKRSGDRKGEYSRRREPNPDRPGQSNFSQSLYCETHILSDI